MVMKSLYVELGARGAGFRRRWVLPQHDKVGVSATRASEGVRWLGLIAVESAKRVELSQARVAASEHRLTAARAGGRRSVQQIAVAEGQLTAEQARPVRSQNTAKMSSLTHYEVSRSHGDRPRHWPHNCRAVPLLA